MARRIADDGLPLTVWARRAETVAPFRDVAAVASTPVDLGAQSDVVGICVVADSDVEDVLLRPDGVLAGMKPGGVIAVHSTVHPTTCRRIADRAAVRGVRVVDAPVSGGGGAAAERKLLVMAGGAEDDLERCRPVFESFADPIIHLGPVGAGQIAKLLNNFVFTAQLAAALETYEFAADLGVDQSALARVLENGSGESRAATLVASLNFDLTPMAQVATSLLRKDVGLMLDIAAECEVAEPNALAPLAANALETLTALAATEGPP
jgi:3-hydroxyisobutyrate dehydrogenase